MSEIKVPLEDWCKLCSALMIMPDAYPIDETIHLAIRKIIHWREGNAKYWKSQAEKGN